MPDITAPDRLPPAPVHQADRNIVRGPNRPLPPAPIRQEDRESDHREDHQTVTNNHDNGQPQDEKIRVNIINTQEEASKAGKERAEERKNEILRHPPGWSIVNWARRIGMRWIEGGWVSIQKDRYMEVMRRNGSTLLTTDMARGAAAITQAERAQHQQKQEAVIERFQSRNETDLANRGELKRTLDRPENQEVRNLIVNEILRPITNGTVTNPDQVQAQLAQFVLNHIDNPLVREFFGAEANMFGDRAQFFATDLFETGQRVKIKMEQENKSLGDLDHLIEVTVGLAKGGAMTDTRGNIDQWVAAAKRRQANILASGAQGLGFHGIISNPAVVGIAGSLAAQGLLRGAGAAGRALDLPSLGVGSLMAGVAAGVRARSEFRADRAMSQVQRVAYGQTPEANARKHQELARFDYQTVQAEELLRGGGTDSISGVPRRSFDDLLTADLTLEANRTQVFSRIAEIDSRIEYGNMNNVDLISYSGKDVMERQRMQMDQEIARARITLRRTGLSNTEIDSEIDRLKTEANRRLIQNREAQDQQFEQARMRYALRQGGQAALFGAVFGLASQEGVALASRAASHIADNVPIAGGLKNIGLFRQTGSTIAEIPWNKVMEATGHDNLRTDISIASLGLNLNKVQELYQHPGNMDFQMPDGSHYTLAVGDSYQASLLDAAGNRVPTGPLEITQEGHVISWGPVPDQLKSTLKDTLGWTINENVPNPDYDLAKGVTRWMEAVQNGNAEHITGIHGNMIYDLQPDGQMSVTLNPTTDNVMIHGFGTMTDGKGMIDVDPTFNGNAEAFANHGDLIRNELGAAGFQVDVETIPGHDETVDIADYLREKGELSPTMRELWHDNQTPMRFVNGRWIGADGKELQLYHHVKDVGPVTPQQALSHIKEQIPPQMLRNPHVQQLMQELQKPGTLQSLTPEKVQQLVGQLPPEMQKTPQVQAAVEEFNKVFQTKQRVVEVDFAKMVSQFQRGVWRNWDYSVDNQYNRVVNDIVAQPDGTRLYRNFEVMITPNKALDSARQAVVFSLDKHPELLTGKLDFDVNSEEAKMFFQLDENGNPIANSFGPQNYQKAAFIEIAHMQPNGLRTILATSQGPGIDQWHHKTPDHQIFHVTPPSSTELIPPEAPLPGDTPWLVTPGRTPRHPLERTTPGLPPIEPPVRERYPGLPTYEGNFPPGSRMKNILRRKNQGRIEPGRIQVNDSEGQRALQEAKDAFGQADSIYFVLGGAIGDSVIATAYLRGIEEALRQQGRNTPITIIANQDYGNLFDGLARGNVSIIKAPRGTGLSTAERNIATAASSSPLIIDFEHYRDENPAITKDLLTGTTTISNLLGPSIELYNNNTDRERRYSHVIEDLFSLNKDSIPPQEARPSIPPPANKDRLYQAVAQRCGIDMNNQNQIGIVVEGSRAGKRYSLDNWTQVISEISAQKPGYQFNILYNANNPQSGYGRVDIERAIARAGLTNVHIIEANLEESVSLMDKQKLVLSNDTGFAHVAASIENGPKAVTIFTPKNFPPVFWVSSDRQIPVMISSTQEARLPDVDINVDDERQKLINKIPPRQVAQAAITQLP